MKLSIVLSTHSAQFEAVAFKGDLEANLAQIAGMGYAGVELAIRDPRLVDVSQLGKALNVLSLHVPAIGTGQAWGEEKLSLTSFDPTVRQAAVERLCSHLPLAERLDALVIIGLIRGITPHGQSHAESMQFLVENLRQCARSGAQYGVRFAVEPLNRYETDLIRSAAEGMALLEQVGADNVGLLLDTFHMNIEEPDIQETIRMCGERIFHFHVADSNRWYPGAGHIPFPSILETLYSTGYQGWVSGEFMPAPDPVTAARNSIAYLKQLNLSK